MLNLLSINFVTFKEIFALTLLYDLLLFEKKVLKSFLSKIFNSIKAVATEVL